MSRSVKEQVKSGLRLGGGLAVFLVAMAPLVDGLRRVVWAAPSHQLLWSPIGLAELIVAAGLLVSTAQVCTTLGDVCCSEPSRVFLP
jgi:hypothetical protein